MIESTKNQIALTANPYQGNALKVLCVCSVGMLRSPTLANWLHTTFGYNTRSCGTNELALIPLSTALLEWADMVVFVDNSAYNDAYDDKHKKYFDNAMILSIPDNYEYMEPELIKEIEFQYNQFT